MAKIFTIGPYEKTVYLIYTAKGQKVPSLRVKTLAELTLADAFSEDTCTHKLAKGWRAVIDYGRSADAGGSPERLYFDVTPGDDPSPDPDPIPIPVPFQLCLCGDETKSCGIEDNPDCDNPNICTPLVTKGTLKKARGKKKKK